MSASGQNTGSARNEVEVFKSASHRAPMPQKPAVKPILQVLSKRSPKPKTATPLPRYSRILRRA